MAFDADQRESLRAALSLAFPTYADLEQLADSLDKNLQAIAGTGPTDDVIFNLVRKAIAGGWENALVEKAVKRNPGNPALAAFYERNWLPLSAPPRRQLELVIRPGEQFEDIETWIARLQETGPRVCAIRAKLNAGRGYVRGTGILVGPDLVLTNYHVLEPVILGEQGQVTAQGCPIGAGLSGKATEVVFQFDYKETPDSVPLNAGRSYALKPGALSEWLRDHSPYSPLDFQSAPASAPSETELDYALVQLANAPADDSIRGGKRGYLPLPEAAEVHPDWALFIIQHPNGKPLKLAFHVVKDLFATRITYLTNTEEGSSGSPCFNYRWELVAMHHLGDPRFGQKKNQGIPIALIRQLLTTRGVTVPP